MSSQLILAWWLNKRLIQLHAENAGREQVGVRRRNGEYRYVRWLGFVGKAEAQRMGRPVKLRIWRVGLGDGFGVDWVDVPAGRHVQGCMTREGAYAVIEQSVRMV